MGEPPRRNPNCTEGGYAVVHEAVFPVSARLNLRPGLERSTSCRLGIYQSREGQETGSCGRQMIALLAQWVRVTWTP